MNAKQALKLSMFAGEIMLSSGAETYRVEDTILRILNNFGFKNIQSYVTVTGIMASVEDEELGHQSMIKRVHHRSNNLGKIALINQFSRDLENKNIDIEDAFRILKHIEQEKNYNKFYRFVASGAVCAAFAFMFGGNGYDSMAALITGLTVFIVADCLKHKRLSNMIVNMISGAFISFVTIIIVNFFNLSNNFELIMISAMMPFVPGLLFTNAVRDILEEDFLSGTARLFDALLISVSLAIGVGTVMKIWIHFFGGFVV